jgi:hypothetical protein
VTAEQARLAAAQAKADAIRAQVGDWAGVGPRLLIAVIDPDTNTRLATCFAGYHAVDTATTPLRLVEDAS